MTPETRAAVRRVRAFLAAWDERHTTRDQVLVQVKPGSADMLTSDDLRALLAAADPPKETFGERVTRLIAETTTRYPHVDPTSLMIYIGEPDPAHPRRFITLDELRRIAQGFDQADRHLPLTDEPIDHIPTRRGLSYLAIRRQQHPKADR